ncbi:uncharacterized protein [Antedon mediterranea]|uniref:uncharacterized protein n=1 Tax=Antedon mediterranea TaxID=105859 RepID=UPI003AF70759
MGILSINNAAHFNNIANLVIQGPAIQSQHVTASLKQNYKTPKEEVYNSELYQRRTSTELVSSYDDNIWSGHYQRRKAQRKDGFFTPQHRPYQTIGQIQLNSKELVADVFEEGFSNRFRIHDHPPTKPCIKSQGDIDKPTKGWNKEDVQDDDLSKDKSKQNEKDLANQTAGLTYIQRQLNDLEITIARTKAGQQFQTTIQDIEHQRELAECNQSQTQVISFCAPTSPSFILRSSSRLSKGSKHTSSCIMSTDSVRSGASTSSTAAKPVEDHEEELARLVSQRKKKAELNRIRCIIMVLNALHNMKTRDIRSRVPLSHETVNFLFRDVILDIHGRPVVSRPTFRGHPQMEKIQSTETLMSHDSGGQGHMSRVMLKNGSGMVGRAPSRSDRPGSTTSPQNWKKYKSNKRSERMIETWDDFLAFQTHGGQHRSSMAPNTAAHQVVTSQYRQQVHSTTEKNPHKPTFWMTVSQSNSDLKASHSNKSGVDTKAKEKKRDPHDILISFNDNFKNLQRKLVKEVNTDLQRLNRDRCKRFRQKFHNLTLTALFEKTLQNMRDAVVRKATPDDVKFEIKPSKWYTDLQYEIESSVGKDDPDVQYILHRLSRFSLEDSRSISNAKEKLCLLVMSIPAVDLLTVAMQQAIRFILEKILDALPTAFPSWLNHRKLPLIVN